MATCKQGGGLIRGTAQKGGLWESEKLGADGGWHFQYMRMGFLTLALKFG